MNETPATIQHRMMSSKYKMFPTFCKEVSDTISVVEFQHNENRVTCLGDLEDDGYLEIGGIELRHKVLSKFYLPHPMGYYGALEHINKERSVFVQNTINPDKPTVQKLFSNPEKYGETVPSEARIRMMEKIFGEGRYE